MLSSGPWAAWRSDSKFPSLARLVGEMRRRCKELVWITPESQTAWGVGDSAMHECAMHEYEPHCDKVVVAYSLRSLQIVVEDLLAVPRGRAG